MRFRLATITAVVALVWAAAGPVARAGCGSPPAMKSLSFATPTIVDRVRAGGEPSVFGLPDGTLLYASHAGTTQLYKPNIADPAFATSYNNSVYLWRSLDDGASWRYVGLGGTDAGPQSFTGFSDPSIAVDAAGNAYLAGIDLANVYVSKSSDSGATWSGQPLAAIGTDREWLAADEANVVYLNGNSLATGRTLWKSKDGGMTWDWATGRPLPGGGAPSPIAVDRADGRLYFPSGNSVVVFPHARADAYDSFTSAVPGGLPAAHGFLNPVAVDHAGNVYTAWNTDHSVGVAYSTDRGMTWNRSIVAMSPDTMRWPWVSAGADGRVGMSWLQGDATDAYRVWGAVSITAHGWVDLCDVPRAPVWSATLATPDAVHVGSICEQGTACNLDLLADRRLGDYLTNSISASGGLVIAYADTAVAPNSDVSRPGFVHQATGPDLTG